MATIRPRENRITVRYACSCGIYFGSGRHGHLDGTYTNANFTENHGVDGTLQLGHGTVASVSASGEPDNWITIAAYPDGNDTWPLLRFDGSGGIEIKSVPTSL